MLIKVCLILTDYRGVKSTFLQQKHLNADLLAHENGLYFINVLFYTHAENYQCHHCGIQKEFGLKLYSHKA